MLILTTKKKSFSCPFYPSIDSWESFVVESQGLFIRWFLIDPVRARRGVKQVEWSKQIQPNYLFHFTRAQDIMRDHFLPKPWLEYCLLKIHYIPFTGGREKRASIRGADPESVVLWGRIRFFESVGSRFSSVLDLINLNHYCIGVKYSLIVMGGGGLKPPCLFSA